MKAILQRLITGEVLSKEEAKEVLLGITSDKYNNSQITAFLTVYMMRPITADELNGFREALLEKAVKIDLGTTDAIDLCGTGGDGKNTFNISTLASLVVAGAGHKVIKHGNYGVSSSCGSSNVLEACGYTLTNDQATLKSHLAQGNFCYLHAPLFHPSMKSVGPIRKELGMKTFFNMIGPLVNPVQPKYQIVGVWDMTVGNLYNDILKTVRENYTILHSKDGYDEISLTGNFYTLTKDGQEEVLPEALGLNRVKPEELFGGDTVEEAKEIFMKILSGEGTEAQNNAVIINAATAINTITGGHDFYDALAEARISLLEGKALNCLKSVTGKA